MINNKANETLWMKGKGKERDVTHLVLTSSLTLQA